MWARKRIDIGFGELISALVTCAFARNSTEHYARSTAMIAGCFDGLDNPLVCLSVRSGFDLLLKTASQLHLWPADSEIIFSGPTIPDMLRIAEAHGLKVVGCDVDWKTLAPCMADLESKIGPRTKAIVVAHLLGAKIELGPIADLAARHDLLLIEDCAQSFTGCNDISPQADASMLSFGAIKTNTALGGALISVRDQRLATQMIKAHQDWPVQTKWQYLKKLARYIGVKAISSWAVAALIRLSFKTLGSTHDCLVAKMARGFAGPNFFQQIRRRPSAGLVAVLARRLKRFDTHLVLQRINRGELLMRTISDLNEQLLPLGILATRPTHWVFAVLVTNRNELVQALWDQGFDATTKSSLVRIENSDTGEADYMRHIVFLPIDLPMPERELVRMGRLVAQIGKSELASKKVPA